MVRKSDKSALIQEFNRKREMVTSGMAEIFLKVEGRRIKPYNFGLARDGGFCIFLKGDSLSNEDLDKIQKVAKAGGFIIYIATENQGYIAKPSEVKIYENERAQRFRELVSEEISKFHMKFLNP
jgi:hypothetical protein